MEQQITFSDSESTSDLTTVIEAATPLKPLDLEEYCKRFPDRPECLEYDL